MPPRLAAALVFLASGAVLVLEVVGLRLVGPYVGVTLQTSSAVIGVALAAIAYGAWTGGWLADRLDPRRLLAPALLAGGLTTAAVLPLVRWAGELLRGTSAPSVLLLTMLTLFVPAAILSAVAPVVVKLQLTDLRETGRVVGRLSSIGTLGGITATLGTGFILVAAVPTSVIVLCLAGVLALVGLAIGGYAMRTSAGATAVLIAGGLLVTVAPNPCDVETAYHCARVTVDPLRPTGRVLWLNSVRHSYVDVDDPAYLEFAYTKWIGAMLDGMAPTGAGLRALHLGGGGFTLPNYLAWTRPGSESLVLELDPELVRLDREELGLRTGPNLTVRTGDARAGLRAVPTASQDVVIGDAFGHLTVPWHLATRELVADVRRVLTPGGIYALNLIDGPARRFARAEVATIAAVFPYVAVVTRPAALRGETGANYVVFASRTPLPLGELAPRLSALPDVSSLVADPSLAEWVGDARVLTDDFAPVDQLLS